MPTRNRPTVIDRSSPRPASSASAKLESSVYRAGAETSRIRQPRSKRKPSGHHRGSTASVNARAAIQRQGVSSRSRRAASSPTHARISGTTPTYAAASPGFVPRSPQYDRSLTSAGPGTVPARPRRPSGKSGTSNWPGTGRAIKSGDPRQLPGQPQLHPGHTPSPYQGCRHSHHARPGQVPGRTFQLPVTSTSPAVHIWI